MLFGVCGGHRTGEELLRGAASGDDDPKAILSFCKLRLKGLDMTFWGSWTPLSAQTVIPLLVFPRSHSPLRTLLSSDADLLSSDLNLDREKRPLERCPMLMLRTTRDFLEGLCKTCFNTAVFLPEHRGVTTSLSAGWLKVKEPLLSSTG